MAAAYLLPRWVKWPHVGKNVTLFSYMVMQHAAHLEIYPLGGTWLVQEPTEGEGGTMLIRSCGSYGTHCYRPRHGRIVEIAERSFPSSIYSFHSRAIRFLTLGREPSFLLFRALFRELFRDVPFMFFFWIKYEKYFYYFFGWRTIIARIVNQWIHNFFIFSFWRV